MRRATSARHSRTTWRSSTTRSSASAACYRTCGPASASGELFELLQRAHAPGDLLVGEEARKIGVAHLADVDVAARVDGEAVRRDELAGLEPRPVAEAREHLALAVDEGQARPDVRVVA